jgi:hypothetical protein
MKCENIGDSLPQAGNVRFEVAISVPPVTGFWPTFAGGGRYSRYRPDAVHSHRPLPGI